MELNSSASRWSCSDALPFDPALTLMISVCVRLLRLPARTMGSQSDLSVWVKTILNHKYLLCYWRRSQVQRDMRITGGSKTSSDGSRPEEAKPRMNGEWRMAKEDILREIPLACAASPDRKHPGTCTAIDHVEN